MVSKNVVVLEVEYTNKKGSPVAQLLGSGVATVLVNGTAVQGRWVRPNEPEQLQLVGVDGQPIRLAPGRTWIE